MADQRFWSLHSWRNISRKTGSYMFSCSLIRDVGFSNCLFFHEHYSVLHAIIFLSYFNWFLFGGISTVFPLYPQWSVTSFRSECMNEEQTRGNMKRLFRKGAWLPQIIPSLQDMAFARHLAPVYVNGHDCRYIDGMDDVRSSRHGCFFHPRGDPGQAARVCLLSLFTFPNIESERIS